MNIPKNWKDEWVYRVLETAPYFHWEEEAVWMVAGRLFAIASDYQDGTPTDCTHEKYNTIIDRLYDIALHGDWLARIKAWLYLEELARFEPEFVEMIRSAAVGVKPTLYQNDIWTEKMHETYRKYASYIVYRLDTYGETSTILQNYATSKNDTRKEIEELYMKVKQQRLLKPSLGTKPSKGLPFPPKKAKP